MSPVFVSEPAAEEPREWGARERRELISVLGRLEGKPSGEDRRTAAGTLRIVPVGRSREALVRIPGPGTVEVHDLLPRLEQGSTRTVSPESRPLAFLPKQRLRAYGVPTDLIAAVRNAQRPEDLQALDLPEEVRARLRPSLLAALSRPLEAVPEVLKYRAESVEVLEKYFRGELALLLLNLTDEQSQIVRLDARGPVLVNGVAGSGKTTVALYRLRRMVEERPSLFGQRLLYLTFNRSLADAARQLLRHMRVPMDDVEVWTLHQWCIRQLGYRRRRILPGHEVEDLLGVAVREVRRTGERSAVLDADLEFWKAEVSDVLKGRRLANLGEYLSVERVGRGAGLTEPARRVVWKVFEAYQRAKGERPDWDDVLLDAFRMVDDSNGEMAYDHVYVDEAQDLPPVAMEMAQLLAGGLGGSLFITADPSQSIYRRGFRWKEVGVRVVGRSYSLTRNYRGTAQILAAARRVWEDLEAGSEEELRPEPSPREGGRPRVVFAGSFKQQVDWVADEIHHLLAEGLARPENIAVLARRVPRLKRLEQVFRERGIRSAYFRHGLRLDDPKVKLITIHSAKGLEFPLVYVVGADDEEFITAGRELTTEARKDALVRARKLLYVSMTRAMHDLTLIASSPQNSQALLGQLTDELVERVFVDAR